ncbi:MAG TPA: alpha/beta hydrolase [Niabella sp.]|nr:alpha/beta hydrolase [Niabella sp.]
MMHAVFYCLAVLFSCSVVAQGNNYKKEDNIVYGVTSGTALLMDVYRPFKANGKGLLYIPGSGFGFTYPLQYDQPQLKDDVDLDSAYTGAWVRSLVNKGYTLFVINHRFTPAFQYKDIINDCRRAVRFIRSHAEKYNIDVSHIGAVGHSSGGCLAALLGTSDESFEEAPEKTDTTSFRVQVVVTLAAPFDLSDYKKQQDTAIDNDFAINIMSAYVGELPETKDGSFLLSGKYAEASPLAHVSTGDAPTLIYYSDNDPIIPPRHAVVMYEALKKNQVPAKIVERKGQNHGPVPDMDEVDQWFKTWLK